MEYPAQRMPYKVVLTRRTSLCGCCKNRKLFADDSPFVLRRRHLQMVVVVGEVPAAGLHGHFHCHSRSRSARRVTAAVATEVVHRKGKLGLEADHGSSKKHEDGYSCFPAEDMPTSSSFGLGSVAGERSVKLFKSNVPGLGIGRQTREYME